MIFVPTAHYVLPVGYGCGMDCVMDCSRWEELFTDLLSGTGG